jgi:hypothetical protein
VVALLLALILIHGVHGAKEKKKRPKKNTFIVNSGVGTNFSAPTHHPPSSTEAATQASVPFSVTHSDATSTSTTTTTIFIPPSMVPQTTNTNWM